MKPQAAIYSGLGKQLHEGFSRQRLDYWWIRIDRSLKVCKNQDWNSDKGESLGKVDARGIGKEKESGELEDHHYHPHEFCQATWHQEALDSGSSTPSIL